MIASVPQLATHARIVEDPLRVVRLQYGGCRSEHLGIEADACVDVVDSDVHVKAFHELFLLRWVTGAHAMSHVTPRQQLSVRYSISPFMVRKLAE